VTSDPTFRRLVLVLGGTSDIAQAVARLQAGQGHDIALAARQPDLLADEAAHLRLRYGVAVTLHSYDALADDSAAALFHGLPRLPDTVLCCIGLLPSEAMATDPDAIRIALRSNAEGPIVALSLFAKAFQARDHGTLIGIASVAGLRGRASNGLYGAGKATFIAWLSALRNQTAGSKLRVITVLPGFVDTRMTAHLQLPKALTATPDEVAAAILRAEKGRRDVVYVRPVWRWIMAIIVHLPEPIFKRLKL
jgi:decaprenylphospho-beta-D-erythro-pentofuranosid-2-ulose 2-reductase